MRVTRSGSATMVGGIEMLNVCTRCGSVKPGSTLTKRLETADHQPRAHKQDQRQRHLHRHQRLSATAGARASSSPRPPPPTASRAAAGELEDWDESEQEP